jgi:ABC-2 type transport system permease protein
VTLLHPIVYLISGFRWRFFNIAEVNVGVTLLMTMVFLAICFSRVESLP